MSKHAPDKLLILSVILAVLIVAGSLFFVIWKNSSPAHPAANTPSSHAQNTSLSPPDGQIMIQSSLQTCAKGDTCIVVDTTCSFCCKYTAINAKHEKLFNDLFDNSCDDFSGTPCQCFDLSSYPACINGKCQLVKWDEEEQGKKQP